jgi:dihydrofolate reductase
MRKVKLFIAPKPRRLHCRQRGRGHRLWLFTDADADYGYSQFYDSIDRILIGRKTYDQSLEFVTNTHTRAKQKGVYVFTENAKRTGD